ncbi:MAG: tRNA (N(6)-L-threonylcarbamoyladenosine(37)-C(2))-methylthiotransferase MtaB [Rhodospirillales bacterium]
MAQARIITLGCRLNTFESAIMRANTAGIEDTVVINTCAVTAEAERQARQVIRRLRRERPGVRIIVTGCAAQLDPGAFAAMEEVDRVVGNADKLDAALLTADDGEDVVVSDIMALRETAGPFMAGPPVTDFAGRTRAFVQVQQGCDHRCTFCIIPFARGPNRSVPLARIVEQVQGLVDGGTAEIVLTGVDVCSYGADLPSPKRSSGFAQAGVAGRPSLGRMVRHLLERVPALRRLRLTSLDPAAMDDDLFRLLAEEPRFMPHLHLSLQAGDDVVLKRMKRRHTRADAIEACRRARRARADVVFGADLIAGFPTETEPMFANTLAAVAEMGLTYLHVFPYSPRPGTPAARMPEVPATVRKERAAVLRAAGEKALAGFLESRIGTIAEVLVEKGRSGRCRHYAPVQLGFDAPAGAVVGARIANVVESRLVGTRAA